MLLTRSIKRLLGLVVVIGATVLITEFGMRIAFYLKDGFNPYYLRFGLVADSEFHSVDAGGYSKFQPNSVKHQKYKGRTLEMRINAQGFRSTGQSDPPADSSRLKVATLGASSTFGYYVENHETYPAVLERSLGEDYPDLSPEVYNLGIPHLRLENIVELAASELPLIQPHFVTLYCGYNNIGQPNPETTGRAAGVKDWLYFHSVLYRIVRPAIKFAYLQLVRATNEDPAQLGHLSLPIMLSADEIEAMSGKIVADFSDHLRALKDEVEGSGATLILVTQNYNLKNRRGSGLEDRWRSYEEELRHVERMLSTTGQVSAVQASILLHHDLMVLLRAFAEQHGLTLVDGIAAMTTDPSQMESGVHLSPQGNRVIAAAIHEGISRHLDGRRGREL